MRQNYKYVSKSLVYVLLLELFPQKIFRNGEQNMSNLWTRMVNLVGFGLQIEWNLFEN